MTLWGGNLGTDLVLLSCYQLFMLATECEEKEGLTGDIFPQCL
jgi:hypothetical protein